MSKRVIGRVAGILLSLALAACASTPAARYYALSAVTPSASAQPRDVSVALGPIDLPQYLERPQIVTRTGDNRLNVDEFNRWGGALEEEVSKVLARYLGGRLGTQRVYGYPSRIAVDTDYRIAIEIRTFDGALGGDVDLEVAWSLFNDRNGAVLQTGQSSYHGNANGADYAAYAAALSGLLSQFGNDLAAAVGAVEPAQP